MGMDSIFYSRYGVCVQSYQAPYGERIGVYSRLLTIKKYMPEEIPILRFKNSLELSEP
jgi:hypothetical protein